MRIKQKTQIESRDNKASRLDIVIPLVSDSNCKIDVKVKTDDDTYINVELQCVDTFNIYVKI